MTLTLDAKTGLGDLVCEGGPTVRAGGRVGFPYPADSTIDGTKERVHRSREFSVDMPWAVLWIGQRGVYFHEWPGLEHSMGCIHLLPGDAERVYNWISGRTRVVFHWK
jgi:lipoprotein-anchoring transpeptidase ErfK/SrfK